MRHFSEQNFFLRPLAFCENRPPQFGQISTYSSSQITSSSTVSALPSRSYCVESKNQPSENLKKYPKFTEIFFAFPRSFHGLFRSLFPGQEYWKTAENAVFIGILSGFLLFLIASYSYSMAPGPRFLRKFLKEGPTVFVTLRRREVGRPPGVVSSGRRGCGPRCAS